MGWQRDHAAENFSARLLLFGQVPFIDFILPGLKVFGEPREPRLEVFGDEFARRVGVEEGDDLAGLAGARGVEVDAEEVARAVRGDGNPTRVPPVGLDPRGRFATHELEDTGARELLQRL